MKSTIFISAFLLLLSYKLCAQDDPGTKILTGSYLGQKPPEMTPEIFAPGFISTKEYGELNSVFSNNGKEFYFSRRGVPGRLSTIMFTKLINGTWSIPEMVNFSGKKDDIDLFITADGMLMIFCSDEINPGNNKSYPDHNFWISDREEEKWSDPVPFATETVSEFEDYFPIVTQSCNLYFNSQRSGPGTNDIYCSKYINGSYNKPEKMPAPINTPYREFDAFVSQDETFIIFSSDKPGGNGRSDLYITMKRNDGSWSEPRNLGAIINSGFSEYGAAITPDGKYLFFTSNRNGSEDIFWVSVIIIEELRPKE
ncbi:MAG: hypothetical protein V1903_09070 [Bacteroidota bacterium]